MILSDLSACWEKLSPKCCIVLFSGICQLQQNQIRAMLTKGHKHPLSFDLDLVVNGVMCRARLKLPSQTAESLGGGAVESVLEWTRWSFGELSHEWASWSCGKCPVSGPGVSTVGQNQSVQ